MHFLTRLEKFNNKSLQNGLDMTLLSSLMFSFSSVLVLELLAYTLSFSGEWGPFNISLVTDETPPKVLFQPFPGHNAGVRACWELQEKDPFHERWMQGCTFCWKFSSTSHVLYLSDCESGTKLFQEEYAY